MIRASELGPFKEVQLSQGTIRYREMGSGEMLVFVHGLLVNGDLWRKVVPALTNQFRCIVPDWPLGSHEVAMNEKADLSPTGLARLISDFLAALDLNDVTLVANDSGGAFSQIVITQYPERVGRVVLTNCDSYDSFLPLFFRPLQWGAHLPGFVFVMSQLLRLRAFQRTPNAYGWLSKYGLEDRVLDSYVGPLITNPSIRRDVTKVLKTISARYTLEAATRFGGFDKPVLIAWASQDRFFPVRYAQRLQKALPNARLELIKDSRTLVPEDQPERLVELIEQFVTENSVSKI
ncbi:MAG TPA: alpha/beta hydrolase [Chloroflexia bacterium]|nr:alpha/beta hydrolase [Chloroflexia bacterium]